MYRIRLLVTAVCVVTVVASAHAQSREVTGRVTDTATGQAVRDATVGIVGQQAAACTNERGEYRLTVPAGEVSLWTAALGSVPRVISLGPAATSADFQLEKQGPHRPGEVVALAPHVTGGVPAQPTAGGPLLVIDGVVVSEPVVYCSGGQLIRIGRGAN